MLGSSSLASDASEAQASEHQSGGDMRNQVIGDLLPSAVGVALSPVPIVAVILMLGTRKARTTGVAFAMGWVLGLVVVTTLVLVLAGGVDDPSSDSSTVVDLAKLVFGGLFFALAAKQWRGRPRPGEEPTLPGWMATIDGFSAGKSLVMGALLSGVNPKNLALTFASASTIAAAGLSAGDAALAAAVFIVIGSISVAGPVVLFLVASERAVAPLASVKQFMSDHVAVIMMMIFLVLGANLLGAGYAGLTR
jgi:threonine/homoserine/homoserine lactone efflux protein